MEIFKAPHPILNKKSRPIKKVDREILEIIQELRATLLATKDPKGVGLAAPQIGKLLRIFVTKPWPKSPLTIFINPQIIWQSEEKTNGVPQRKNKFEGCLSIPSIWGMIHRYQLIRLAYQTPDGKHHKRNFRGFLATIIQHEMDHLNGTLFTQRVLEQKEKLYKLVKDKEGKEIFREIEL